MAKYSFIALIALLPLAATATNDWSQPCLQGNGSPDQISDITSAAGWEILNCSSTASAQDILLMCSGDEISCSHLFQNGAENTIVRLPENCGAGPFARVASVYVPEDQSIQDQTSSRILRRNGTSPVVHGLSVDTNFDQAPPPQNGSVTFYVSASTDPAFAGNATVTPPALRSRSRKVDRRGVRDAVFNGINEFSKRFNDSDTKNVPISVNKQFNIFNTTLSCSSNEEAKLSVDVGVQATGNVTLGFIAAGSIFPPKLTEATLFATMTANLDGSLTISADIAGEVDSGSIPLLTLPLAGFDIAGIIQIGPQFVLNAEATANIDLDVDMSIDLAYNVDSLQLFFPPSSGHTSTANVSPQDTPLKLSVSPDVSSNATFEAHLIPTIEVDTFAALDLGLEAGATASVDTSGATGASAQVGGCVDVNGGVSINAGASGSFFGLFDDSTQVSLFSKDFDLFQKCFSDQTSTTNAGSVTVTSTTASSISSSTTQSSVSVSTNATDVSAQSLSASATTTATSVNASSETSSASILSSSSVRLSASSSETSSVSTSTASPVSTTTTHSSSASTSHASLAPTGKSRTGKSARSIGGPISKRGFSCPTGDVAAATSVADQTLSASEFVFSYLTDRENNCSSSPNL
ncbi:hypothetical protein EW145_g4539 [Phellinidium pouzarii]|uniref:DUF7223 domain-containing protein n=1 Tax=Phellinidium pouzarii TaxID=167371 RepID=A0A4S4L3A6_9AGAM|nr:hypothetical protein EW145_g4539 [Phellinidium pouzarii]